MKTTAKLFYGGTRGQWRGYWKLLPKPAMKKLAQLTGIDLQVIRDANLLIECDADGHPKR